MEFGPFELQSCGENDFTTKTLGILAHRQDLRARLIRKLVGEDAIADNEKSSILFFSRIGENFFREAIEREAELPSGAFERQCNQAIGLPPDFRWHRGAGKKLTQPAKWNAKLISNMVVDNGCEDDSAIIESLSYLQDILNTEPDVVLQWGKSILMLEVKVLSSEGMKQLERQRKLSEFLAALTGLKAYQCLLAPEYYRPKSQEYECKTWTDIANWFDDVPEITEYIHGFSFFYHGSRRSMISERVNVTPQTAWDLMVANTRNPAPHSPIASVNLSAPDADWTFERLGQEYFAEILQLCSANGVQPTGGIWTGVMGSAYIDKGAGRRVRPNWMIEVADGTRYTNKFGFDKPHEYKASNMRRWAYEKIVEFCDLELD